MLQAVRKEENMAEYKPTALQTSKRYLTATDVAELLGVSRSTAYRIIKRLNSGKSRKADCGGQGICQIFLREYLPVSDEGNRIRAMKLLQIGGEIIADLQRRKDRVMVL